LSAYFSQAFSSVCFTARSPPSSGPFPPSGKLCSHRSPRLSLNGIRGHSARLTRGLRPRKTLPRKKKDCLARPTDQPENSSDYIGPLPRKRFFAGSELSPARAFLTKRANALRAPQRNLIPPSLLARLVYLTTHVHCRRSRAGIERRLHTMVMSVFGDHLCRRLFFISAPSPSQALIWSRNIPSLMVPGCGRIIASIRRSNTKLVVPFVAVGGHKQSPCVTNVLLGSQTRRRIGSAPIFTLVIAHRFMRGQPVIRIQRCWKSYCRRRKSNME